MFINLIFIITSIFTLTGFYGHIDFWFDLTAHFRAQYFGIQLLCLFYYASRKRWVFSGLATVSALINLTLIVPLYMRPANVEITNGKDISILLINVNSDNKEYDKIIEYVKQIKPDILALEEINGKSIMALSSLLDTYPYRVFEPRNDNFGIGMYSKIPPKSMQRIYFAPAIVPSIVAQYKINNRPVTLVFTHTLPPFNLTYYKYRNRQLNEIAEQRPALGKNLILIGDLNTTSWSNHFDDFIKKMGLVDTRRGFGLQISWPTMCPLLGVAIDHILVSPNIKVFDRIIGPYIGSDHYPVLIYLGIQE